MLILLPPSETKSRPQGQAAASLSFPELTSTRLRIMNALVRMSSGNPQRAGKALGLGHTQLDQLQLNIELHGAPCAPAIEVYTGVLYEALDGNGLTSLQRERLNEHTAIASALHGLVRPLDSIPAYRLSAGARLTSLPSLPSLWHEPVGHVIEASTGPILDLRSQSYANLAPIPPTAASRAITVRVLQEQNGKRIVVSHFNKATKGGLVRDLVRQRTMPTSTAALLRSLTSFGYQWELQERAGQPSLLDIITHYTPGKVSTPRR